MCRHGFFNAGDENNLDFFVFKFTKVWALLDPNSSGFWTFIYILNLVTFRPVPWSLFILKIYLGRLLLSPSTWRHTCSKTILV